MVTGTDGQEIGAVPQGVKTRALTMDGAEWKDTPYFIAGIPDDAPNALALKAGQQLSGKVIAVRPTQDKKHNYACMEDRAGNKFRLRLGKVLLGHFQTLATGTEVIVTFNGKKEAVASGNEYNDFTIELVEGNLN